MDPARDPVCGMTPKPDGPHRHSHGGVTYRFCSARCLEKFRAAPESYLEPRPQPKPAPEPAGATYTCPMHREVHRPGPGSCPICGMALEPLSGVADGPDPELADMTRRLWLSALLTVPVVALGMAESLPWLQLVLATPVALW